MKRTFKGVWYVQKEITRKGTTCLQWFKCKAPEPKGVVEGYVGYLGEKVACDEHQEAAMADVRRSRAGARDAIATARAIVAAPPVTVHRLGSNVISVDDAEAQAMQFYAKQEASETLARANDMAKLIEYADGGIGAELARLENEGGRSDYTSARYTHDQSDACQPETVYVLSAEQILAAATPETRGQVYQKIAETPMAERGKKRPVVYPGEETQTGELTAAQQKWRDETMAKVVDLAAHRQRVYDEAMARS